MYVALDFVANGGKVRKVIASLSRSMPVLKRVEFFLITGKQRHPRYPAKTAFLFSLPLGHEPETLGALAECLKAAFPGLELNWKPDMCDSHSWQYAQLVMNSRQ